MPLPGVVWGMGTNASTGKPAFIETPAARLVYDERGAGEPVVFVHSGITDRRMWDPQMATFGERYRTIRYDLQGFGESTATGPGTNREDLIALLDGLDIARCHLVGASFGSAIALEATLEHPDRVRSLTLVGTGVGSGDYEADTPEWAWVESTYEESVAALRHGDIARAAELEVELWIVGPERTVAEVNAEVRQRVYEMDFGALKREAAGRRQDATALDPSAVERLGDLAPPTLVVVGEYDLPDIHHAAERIERETGAKRVVIEDAAHLPSLERPNAFNTAVLSFLEAV